MLNEQDLFVTELCTHVFPPQTSMAHPTEYIADRMLPCPHLTVLGVSGVDVNAEADQDGWHREIMRRQEIRELLVRKLSFLEDCAHA